MATSRVGRRAFLGQLALTGALPSLQSLPSVPPLAPAPEASDAEVFAEARRHFLIPEGVTYCNTGTLGASPVEVVKALVSGFEAIERELADWPYFQADGEPLTGYQPLTKYREAMGHVVGAPFEETAIVQNATMAMSFLAAGLDMAPGDEVVTTDQEHSGGVNPFHLRAERHGIVVKELSLDDALSGGPEAIVRLFAEAMTPRTRVVMFSHITSGLGIRLPAKELCALARDRGALSFVDGAQAVGQIRVDVKDLGCNAYVGSPHKWLLAPKGTGFLYIDGEAQEQVWTTLASSAYLDRDRGAFRFMQYGTGSVPIVEGLLAAIRFVEAIGIERIERWDTMLTKRLRDGLARVPRARLSSPPDPRFASAITTFKVDGVSARDLQNALWEKKVRVRAQGDARGVRLSAHLYVSPDDIDTVLDVVGRLGAG